MRKSIIKNLKTKLNRGENLIGVASGSGLSAKYAAEGGADFILALNSGKFRQAGLGALGGYLPYTNCNKMVMDFASKEILTRLDNIPVLFGLCATDPTINLTNYIEKIKSIGFAGINNYPTIGMIDGKFREALEESGLSYDLEVEAIRLGKEKDLFTIAFVFTVDEAKKMIDAGADIICCHLGLTQGGIMGAKKVLSLKTSVKITKEIFDMVNRTNKDTIKMVYGGPITSTIDLKYIYDNTGADGYIGGSTFERIPSEKIITRTTREFKSVGEDTSDDLNSKMLSGISGHYDYVSFVKEYIADQYMNDISFSNLAKVAHISRSHLSSIFNQKVGFGFPEYLAQFRINKAKEIYANSNYTWTRISYMVGYKSYPHFSRSFKELEGMSPRAYSKKLGR